MKTKLRMILLPLALSGAAMAAVLVTTGATAANTCTGSACKAPAVTTTPASGVTATSATLTGSVTPNGSDTTCRFNYGTTTGYGQQTPTRTVKPITGTATQSVGITVNGLQSQTVFHYQIVCTNATGMTKGTDVSFTTSDTGPSQIALSGHTGFVSGSGISGVFIGCYGARNCTGSVKLTHNGSVVGQRSFYFIFANHGGIVHIPLGSGAMKQLRSTGHYKVTVASTTSDGQVLQGGDSGTSLTLHLFR